MRPPAGIELDFDTVRVTWCVCEHCAALGPKLITLVRKNRQYTSNPHAECCGGRNWHGELECDDDGS